MLSINTHSLLDTNKPFNTGPFATTWLYKVLSGLSLKYNFIFQGKRNWQWSLDISLQLFVIGWKRAYILEPKKSEVWTLIPQCCCWGETWPSETDLFLFAITFFASIDRNRHTRNYRHMRKMWWKKKVQRKSCLFHLCTFWSKHVTEQELLCTLKKKNMLERLKDNINMNEMYI